MKDEDRENIHPDRDSGPGEEDPTRQLDARPGTSDQQAADHITGAGADGTTTAPPSSAGPSSAADPGPAADASSADAAAAPESAAPLTRPESNAPTAPDEAAARAGHDEAEMPAAAPFGAGPSTSDAHATAPSTPDQAAWSAAAPAGQAEHYAATASHATQQLPGSGYQQAPGYGPPGGTPPPGPAGAAWPQPGPYGPQQPDPYGPQQPGQRGRGRRWLAVGAAAVILVLGGGLVGGVTVHALEGNSPVESTVVSDPVSSKGGSLATMISQVQPSVVSLKVQPDGSQSGDEGSGVIIRSDGMILTNNHVVSSVADGSGSITVAFSDGRQTSAKVVGTDPSGDLAVVKASGRSDLKPATLGDSSKLRVGDGVVAIGSPLGLEGSVTQGIVSAMNRSYTVAGEQQQQPQQQNPFPFGQGQQQEQQQQGGGQSITIPNAIQTDAAINPGNSGGPLLNMSGQVIGINSAIRAADNSSGQGGNIGIGFAIPISTAKSSADQLIKGKKVEHALFGVKVGDALSSGAGSSGTPQGALVAAVTKGGPAARAGLIKGDVVTKVDAMRVTDSESLVSAISQHKPGDKVLVTYTRNGAQKTTTATLAKAPN